MTQLLTADTERICIRVRPKVGAFLPWRGGPVTQGETGRVVIAMAARVPIHAVRELSVFHPYRFLRADHDHDGMSMEWRYGLDCIRECDIVSLIIELNPHVYVKNYFWMFDGVQVRDPWPPPAPLGDFTVAIGSPTPREPCRWVIADTRTGMVFDPMLDTVYPWKELGYVSNGCSFVARA